MGHDIYVYDKEPIYKEDCDEEPIDKEDYDEYAEEENEKYCFHFRATEFPLDCEKYSRAIYEILDCGKHDGGCSGFGTGQYFSLVDIHEALYKLKDVNYSRDEYRTTSDLIKFLANILCYMLDNKLKNIYILFG